jgi:hypothetical protein
MTIEITKESHLTERGDCIVAVSATKGAADLPREFMVLAKNNNARITLVIRVGDKTETITGQGDRRLKLSHPTDLVARKSNYVCSRTLMIHADKAASNLSREFVKALRDPSSTITVEVAVEL